MSWSHHLHLSTSKNDVHYIQISETSDSISTKPPLTKPFIPPSFLPLTISCVLPRHGSLELSRPQSALDDNTKTHSSSSRQRSDLPSEKRVLIDSRWGSREVVLNHNRVKFRFPHVGLMNDLLERNWRIQVKILLPHLLLTHSAIILSSTSAKTTR